MIEVVNRRANGRTKDGAVRVYIGRPSPLGNPFVIGRAGSRAEVIERYERWLKNAMKEGEAKRELERLTRLAGEGADLELECWCSPLACHGDVLKRMIEQQSR